MSLKGFIEECRQNLISSTDRDAEGARDYFNKRGLFQQSWRDHSIGYCSRSQSIPDSVRFFGTEDLVKFYTPLWVM